MSGIQDPQHGARTIAPSKNTVVSANAPGTIAVIAECALRPREQNHRAAAFLNGSDILASSSDNAVRERESVGTAWQPRSESAERLHPVDGEELELVLS